MKGIKQVDINGEKVSLRVTLGAVEDFQEYLESNEKEGEVDIDEALGNMKHARQFLSIMSKYAGNERDAEDFKYMDFAEMSAVIDLVNEAVGEAKGGGGSKKK